MIIIKYGKSCEEEVMYSMESLYMPKGKVGVPLFQKFSCIKVAERSRDLASFL